MGRIQSNIGLITGMPIGNTVESLMALAARPRDMLQARTDLLHQEQIAVTGLSALLLAVQHVTDNLGKEEIFNQRKVTSSDHLTLATLLSGNPPEGTYQFTPLRTVQNHQLLTSGVASDTDPLGGGKLTFRFGDHVQRSAELSLLNGGEGAVRGKIRITDRSGASAEIDLSTAQTVDDVLEAINDNATISVTALAKGDRLRLVDNSGQSVSNLRVQEVGGGTTAASLGIGGIDVAADTADGTNVLRLYEGIDLDALNDGSGVHVSPILDDVQYQLRDGTTGLIDFSPILEGSSEVDKETTLGDVIEVINAADPGKLRAEIAPDGQRLMITDLTEGENAFTLESLYQSDAVEGLGLDGEAADGVIVGRRLLSPLRSVLISSLGGGNGLGTLGSLEITDRSGASDIVDLSGAETLQDVVDAINAAEVEIVAEVNHARNGIQLTDTTGMYASNMIVADADGSGTAEELGIALDAATTSVNSGDMHLQVIAHNTRLDDLNGGAGVARGTLTIADSSGNRDVIDLRDDDIETIADLLREIERLDVGVIAEINDTGDGIIIRDTVHGENELAVYEGNTTTARDLNLLQAAEEVDVGGETTQVIDGSMTRVIELSETDSLDDLREIINQSHYGVAAMTLVDGSSKPFRLALMSDRAGKAGALVVDTSEVSFTVQETVSARDALLVFGDASAADSSILVTSSSNSFSNVLPGVTLTIGRISNTPVTVTVGASDANLVAALQTMVDNYNNFRDRLGELTAVDPETGARSLLTGDSAALRMDVDLSHLLSGQFIGSGSIRSLAEIGVSMKDDGTLSFDPIKLKDRFAQDPDAVRQLFTAENLGVSDKFGKLIEQISGEDASLLASRLTALGDKISQNEKRIEALNERLENQRQRLYLQFYRMEIAVGKLQSNLAALDAIQPLAPLASSQ